LQSKSVEPIALEAGVHPRNLQQFLGIYEWDDPAMGRKVRHIVRDEHGCPDAIGVIDETGIAKKGTKTVGVQRQYCGSTGKVDNCVNSVHIDYVAPDFHTIVDSDLYLPKSWFDDPARCEGVGVPKDLVFRTKPQIALDLIARTLGDGVPLKWITADEGYGQVPSFMDGVAALGLVYVVEVPRKIQGWTPNGRRLGRKIDRVEDLWWRGGPTWTTYSIKETTKGELVWRVRSTVFIPSWDPTKRLRLIVAESMLDGEMKYFLSNAPLETPVSSLLTVAFARWHVERSFEDAKQEVGLDHFEVRGYRSVQRHLTISMLSLLFLSRVSRRLRGEKRRALDELAGSGGDRRTA
jgi:SRSO17 transposase